MISTLHNLFLSENRSVINVQTNKNAFQQMRTARWPALDVSTGGGGVGPQVNKFDQVSSEVMITSCQ